MTVHSMRRIVKLVCYSCVHMLHNKVRMLDSVRILAQIAECI